NVGNVEATQSVKVQIDTIAPTVSITAPANGAKVKGTVTIKASASDSGGAGLASVAFYVDGVLLGTDTVSPWTMAWNTSTAAKGAHTLTVVATDKAGNTKTSAAITVTVT